MILGHMGLLGCLVYITVSVAALGSSTDVIFRCESNQSLKNPMCLIKSMTFLDADNDLSLMDASGKTKLHIKGGKINALRTKQCTSLAKFTKVTIDRVELQELCITPGFEHLSAEHNRIQKLHVEDVTSGYSLQTLQLSHNQLKSIDGICKLTALTELNLEQNALTTLDMACFKDMTGLKKLRLAQNRINRISTATTELELPSLNLITLHNNTLTSLDVQRWTMPDLEYLELAFNSLKFVLGLDRLSSLSEVSLSGNRWECTSLDLVLMAFQSNEVQVTDSDTGCTGIRNGTICCTVESDPNEDTLLKELDKFTELENRYQTAEDLCKKAAQDTVQQMENLIRELKQSLDEKPKTPITATTTTTTTTPIPQTDDETEPETSVTDPNLGEKEAAKVMPTEETPQKQPPCICSKEGLEEVKFKMAALTTKLEANEATLEELRQQQKWFLYKNVLAKEEFRVGVARGEQKLNDLRLEQEMLLKQLKQQQRP